MSVLHYLGTPWALLSHTCCLVNEIFGFGGLMGALSSAFMFIYWAPRDYRCTMWQSLVIPLHNKMNAGSAVSTNGFTTQWSNLSLVFIFLNKVAPPQQRSCNQWCDLKDPELNCSNTQIIDVDQKCFDVDRILIFSPVGLNVGYWIINPFLIFFLKSA